MKYFKIIIFMAIAFAIGGVISFFLFSKESKQEFVNPAQFRTPQLQANQTLQPSFDPGVIAGTKPLQASPNASAAKELEASLGQAVTGRAVPASTRPKTSKPKAADTTKAEQPAQQPTPQPKPKKPSMSDIRDELM